MRTGSVCESPKLTVTVVAQWVTVVAQWVTVVAQRVTVVAQWAKAPGIHCYVAGSIPAVTPRYCTYKENRKMLFRAQKQQRKKKKVRSSVCESPMLCM
jgi:hypothetical protein